MLSPLCSWLERAAVVVVLCGVVLVLVGFFISPNNLQWTELDLHGGISYDLLWVKDEGSTYLFVFSKNAAVGLVRAPKTSCAEGTLPAGKIRRDWFPKKGPDSFFGKAVVSFSRPAGDAVNVLQH